MNDVAAHAGVSLKTVSRVVNAVPSVDPDLAERVRASIATLGFRRNAVAAGLRAGAGTKTIGLVTADLANTFYMTISSAVAEIAQSHGYQVIMASSQEDQALERALTLDLCQRRVSGLIVVPTSADHRYLRAEVDSGTPVVIIDRPARGLVADTILIDNRGGGRAGIEHLLALGHRSIAILMDSLAIYTMAERLAGARAALADAGIAETPELIVDTVHTPDDAIVTMRRLLDSDHPPTAVLCGNNRSTIGVVEELTRRGLTLDVVGFDDFEMSRLLPQPVTIVDYDTAALGSLAAQRLFTRIEGSESEPAELRLPTRLVPRGPATSPPARSRERPA